MAKQQHRKRRIAKIMPKKARGVATNRLARINGVFKKLAAPRQHRERVMARATHTQEPRA